MQTYKTYLRIPSALVVARSNSQGIFVFKITMEKKCTKCGVVKSLDEFYNNKPTKDGKNYRCIVCTQKGYDNKKGKNPFCFDCVLPNFIDIFTSTLIKLKKCTKCNELKILDEFHNNKRTKDGKAFQCIVCITKNVRDKRAIIVKQNLEYNERNKDAQKEYEKGLMKNRIKTDPFLRFRQRVRSTVSMSLKSQGYNKDTNTFNIIKCEYDFLIKWLNGIASNGYTFGIGDLHIDHVIPISLSKTKDEAIILSHYSNLQLLTADENLTKGNRYVNPLNLARVLEHHPNPDKIREIHSRL